MGERLERPQVTGPVDHAEDWGHYPKSNGKLMKGLKQRGDHQGSLLKFNSSKMVENLLKVMRRQSKNIETSFYGTQDERW